MKRGETAVKNYVIIGNGVAAVGCIEGIKSVDKDAKIKLISEERYHVYGRPLISYYLEGKTDLSRMKYRPDNFYEENNVEVFYGKKAVKLDSRKKTITIDDGSEISYDTVCVATGSSPFVPPIDGFENVKNKFTFMTLDDTLSLEKSIDKNKKVFIVGAGLIGLKCAEGLFGRVSQITVCDLADRVLSSILDNECAALMQRRLEKNGIEFILKDSAVRFEKNKAIMKSGKEVSFDILVMAVGVRPNISLVKEAGGDVGRGIIVSDKSETSLIDVYSAGDCTECYDISCGKRRPLSILPNAYIQGQTAGINMAGGNSSFDNAIPMNSIGFFGLHAMSAGSYFSKEDGGECYEEKSEEKIKRLYTKNGLLTGYILIGDIDRAGIYTSLIRNKESLDSIDFELIKKAPSLLPFGVSYRKKKLGGIS